MNVIIKPIVTEKMTQKTESLNDYGFIVNRKANKIEIKKAVENNYGVKVLSVRTMVYRGKEKSRFTKTGVIKGKTNSLKKAIVRLKKDNSIDFYNN
ncbi:MAG: 50S ribosomal protein L23 [Flavobacteriales bacterium]|nr:50S ribosomal protein L23 [Flavobacteriales bacterium]|tara:strand:- start:2065 stop:2352 length:288 start_codon:yes stop_codon:yes gene_type:complete